MTIYELLTLVVGFLTLLVLYWTLKYLKKYVEDTKRIANAANEQLPRPCIVLKQLADPSDMAIIKGTTSSLAPHGDFSEPLVFVNVGTGPAVKCRFKVEDFEEKEEREESYNNLPEIGPSGSFASNYILNALPGSSVIIIKYESVAGTRYRTEMLIEERRWVKVVGYAPPAPKS